MEDSAPEGAMISNQAPEEEASKMVVIKWSDKVKGYGENIDSPLWVGLYKQEEDYLVPWSGTYPYAKMNWFTWSKENDDWIVPEDQYNEEFKKWRGPIHNGQFRSQTLKEKRKTEYKWSNYSVSAKFNGITRKGKIAIPIKSYKDQLREHMIRNGMWDIFSLPNPRNKEKKWDILLH